MRRQIEKNKEILLDEMEKLGDRKLTPESVAALGAYYKAYKALRMICDHTAGQRALYGHEEHHAPDSSHARGEERPAFTHETAMAWVGRMKNEDGTISVPVTADGKVIAPEDVPGGIDVEVPVQYTVEEVGGVNAVKADSTEVELTWSITLGKLQVNLTVTGSIKVVLN